MPLRVVLFVLAAVAFFVLPAIVDFAADWLWFGEVGYRQVYSTEITTRATTGAAAFLIDPTECQSASCLGSIGA